MELRRMRLGRWVRGRGCRQSFRRLIKQIGAPFASISRTPMPLQPSKSENMLWNSRSIGEIQEQGHLEVETKFEISSGDFDRLQTIGNVRRCERQLNVYYDAHWKLADSACTLRIRLANYSSPILALKVPVSKAGEQRVMREFEVLARDLRLES